MKRILITGSRNWSFVDGIGFAIIDHEPGWNAGERLPCVIVHGAARGADTIAANWAEKWQLNAEAHPADWKKHGKAAGPIRNQEMVDLGADVCLAFPTEGSIGTWDCVRRAKKAGIPVFVYREEDTLADRV